MREPARLQAAIDILDMLIDSAASGGAPADTLVRRYFADRRYAGSRDRAAVRALVYDAVRLIGERPENGRAAMLALAADRPDLVDLFDGSPHAPQPVTEGEAAARPSLAPQWLMPEFQQRFGDNTDVELQALVRDRAPLDLRINPLAGGDVAQIAEELGAAPITDLPYGLRLQDPVPLDRHPLLMGGRIEIQDASSQRAVLFSDVLAGMDIIDLCAGAGGKTLALASAMEGRGRILATDTDRRRLDAMTPRLDRSAAADMVRRRLLNPGQELDMLADVRGHADLVFVDAPCSGTGTWRRSPELRWRLTPERLARLIDVQARLIQLAAQLVKPGGRVIYAVCSVLPSEGEAQAKASGLQMLAQLSLSPAVDGCDGFYAAMLKC